MASPSQDSNKASSSGNLPPISWEDLTAAMQTMIQASVSASMASAVASIQSSLATPQIPSSGQTISQEGISFLTQSAPVSSKPKAIVRYAKSICSNETEVVSPVPTRRPHRVPSALEQVVPIVDTLVAALSSPTSVPSDSEGFPKNPVDKRIEISDRRAFKSASSALKASVSASLANRTTVLWRQRFSEVHKFARLPPLLVMPLAMPCNFQLKP